MRQQKRAQIGTTQIDTALSYWSGGKTFSAQKQNERLCYSYIDRYQAEASISDDKEQINALYNEMDLYYTIIKVIEHFGANEELLLNAGICISNAIAEGAFACSFATLAERNSYVDGLVASIINEASSMTLSEYVSSDFIVWWDANIMANNYYITADGAKSAYPPAVQIGSGEDENATKFREGALAFLYTVADIKDIEESDVAMRKRFNQQYSRDVIAQGGLGLSQQVQTNLIIGGTIEKLGMNVPEAIKRLKTGEGVEVGIWEFIAAIVVAVCALLADWLKAKYATKSEELKAEAQKYLTSSYLQMNGAGEGDWELNADGSITRGDNNPEFQKTQRTKYIAVCSAVALVALAYIL